MLSIHLQILKISLNTIDSIRLNDGCFYWVFKLLSGYPFNRMWLQYNKRVVFIQTPFKIPVYGKDKG